MSSVNAGMTNYAASSQPGAVSFIPVNIIGLCIFFNFFLCFINTKITAITPLHIITCEVFLVGVSLLYGFHKVDRLKLFWLVILGLQVCLIAMLSAFKGEILIKPMRDVMIMPVFVAMGLSAYRMNFTKILLAFSIVITIIALCEAYLTGPFLSLFNFRDFFIAKGALEDGINITALDLFASGERPGGRFLLDLPGVHRISSVFLEPVSLGFYAMISGAYFVATKETISKKLFLSGIMLSLFLIWLSDARMAMGTLTAMLLFRPVIARLDQRFAVLIMPIIIFLAYLVDGFDLLEKTGEGMGARFHSTMDLLSHTSFEVLLGATNYGGLGLMDSGLGYLLNDQGLLGLLLFWLPPIFFLKKMPVEARIYLFGISVYFALGMVLSQAFFTIKTAALLWFCYGYLISRSLQDEEGNYYYAT